MRATLLLILFGALHSASLSGARGEALQNAADRPNVLVVIFDDMGYGDSQTFWKSDLETPTLDSIARDGAKFTQFRVNPLCAPTRASVMTGLDSLEAGMWRGPGETERGDPPPGGWSGNERRIRDGLVMLPQLLKQAGYATGCFGKWHLGYDGANLPQGRGFDDFVGFLGGSHPYQIGRNSKILRGSKPLAGGPGHTTDLFADEALRFIKQHARQPFFCYLAFNAVHGPLRSADRPQDSAKPEWLDYYEKRGVAQPRRDYNAVLTHADNRVGEILRTLAELQLDSKTLVVCLSDNGGILEKYPSNNGPFKGGKGMTTEGGIRVPAVLKWPGVIPAGTVSNAPAMHFDVFSTVLDAAGVPVPEKNGPYSLRGVSLLPHLRSGGRTPLPDRYLFWDLYGQMAAQHGDWKIVGEAGNHHGKFDEAARQAEAATFALYNMASDPGEATDLSTKHPAVFQDLRQRHVEWLRGFATKP